MRRSLDSVSALGSQRLPLRFLARAGRAYVGDADELKRVTEVRLAMPAEDWIRVSRTAERRPTVTGGGGSKAAILNLRDLEAVEQEFSRASRDGVGLLRVFIPPFV